jgi:hypothetical protein
MQNRYLIRTLEMKNMEQGQHWKAMTGNTSTERGASAFQPLSLTPGVRLRPLVQAALWASDEEVYEDWNEQYGKAGMEGWTGE